MKLPKIGMRIWKTVLAVFLCLLSGLPRPDSLPFYSVIAATLCMQPDLQRGWKTGLNRIIGTLIGGGCGLAMVILLQTLKPPDLMRILLLSLATAPVIYLTVLFKRTSATQISCVVFFSITVAHLADASPYLFAFHRVLDTLTGILIALVVNLLPPRPQ
ncbi:MAG: FUSC family protein [Anaerotruncus sp.]|nr:FUSC family protein [Anaerotruncus sp.]